MVQQVKCIKNSIARKVLKQKFLKFLKHYYSFNYTKSNRKPRHSEYYNFDAFKQKLNLSHSTSKFNISGVKKKVLKLVDLDLDDCFEVEEEKYGFRSNITLAQNSRCILGSTCRGEPEPNPEPETMATESGFSQNEMLIQNYLEHLERQSGEEFSSDGPPDCRVFQSSQCDTNV